jgi:indole-3-glycerol phosphate synthase
VSVAGPDILAGITAAGRRRLADRPPAADLEARAREAAAGRRRGGSRSLRAALAEPGVRVIAECKHRSPSKGWLREPFDPFTLARRYQAGGAAAVSVVTEPEFFAGQAEWVTRIRREVGVPVLQKDFFVSRRQLLEAAVLGADAVLLIARVLPGRALGEMLTLAGEQGLETLVEVHDSADLERVLAEPAPVVGINARDLETFEVDLEGAARLAGCLPADRTVVLESGVGAPSDVARLVGLGFRCFLIGEYLVRAENPQAALGELLSCR